MKDYIYIIGNDQGFIKVGVSKHPNKRLKQIQTGNEHKLTLLFTEEFECKRLQLLRIESAIHKELKKVSTKCTGEWFSVDTENISKIKNIITFYRIRYEDDLTAFNRMFH